MHAGIPIDSKLIELNQTADCRFGLKFHCSSVNSLTAKGCQTYHIAFYSPVAQQVEQVAVNHLVGGSIPSRGANISSIESSDSFLFHNPLRIASQAIN